MARLFDRVWRVEVEGEDGRLIEVSDLDLAFDVAKSTRAEPNTAAVVIYNLADSTRAKISAADNPRIKVYAGYQDTGAALIFNGDAREVATERSGVEVATTITAADRGRAFQQARVNRTFPAGTRVSTVLEALVEAMGIGRGNLEDVSQGFTLSNGATEFREGFVAAGPVQRVMDGIVRGAKVDGQGAGLRWSVQNGVLRFYRRGQPVQSRATVLSPTSGLLGSPTPGERGEVSAVSLIQPGLDPGRVVRLESTDLDGGYVVSKVKIKGDTRGDVWDTEMVLRPY